jgi:phosphoribosylglycinamide formyltransferase-1
VGDWRIGRWPGGPNLVTARLLVLVSGNGSNLQALIDASVTGAVQAEIVGVISNVEDAFGLERARRHGIPIEVVPRHRPDSAVSADRAVSADSADRAEYDRRLAEVASTYKPDVVVLAGWMRILTAAFLDRFKVLNLHPALPGTFPGLHAIGRAFDAWEVGRVSASGVMVHWVPDEGVDLGPVIDQVTVPFIEGDTLETFETRMHEAEHRLLVRAVGTVVDSSFPATKELPVSS